MTDSVLYKRKSVLIVEDDDEIRETLRFAITMEGYAVLTASNGREGIEILTKMKTPCLILLDLMMPAMNGWEFVMEMQKDMSLAAHPIVVVTAFSEQVKGFDGHDVLRKPIDLYELFAVIRKHCDSD